MNRHDEKKKQWVKEKDTGVNKKKVKK